MAKISAKGARLPAGQESSLRGKKEEKEQTKNRYFEGRGSRKTSVARVRLTVGQGKIAINGKDYREYFKSLKYQEIILATLAVIKNENKIDLSVRVKGGGLTAQAEAIRHGIARALVKSNEEFRKRLRKSGYLTRDSRMVERKKYGLKKARRAPQWAKR